MEKQNYIFIYLFLFLVGISKNNQSLILLLRTSCLVLAAKALLFSTNLQYSALQKRHLLIYLPHYNLECILLGFFLLLLTD